MNASEIITKFENMVGDSLDQDFELQLANDAMHEIEEDVKPEGVKAVDTTDSTFAGQNYTTAIDLPTDFPACPLQVAAGIGWVEGVTYEWSPQATFDAVRMLLDLGLDVNAQADTGRTALHGAAHKGRPDVVQILADRGAKLDVRDYGNTDNRGGKLAVHTWQPVDYADGLVRVGVQSAIAHPETGLLLRRLMTAKGLPAAPCGSHARIDLHYRGVRIDIRARPYGAIGLVRSIDVPSPTISIGA
jgi:hypothetical protein